jgi:hypothetical protein
MTFIEDEENHYEKTKESTKGEDLRHKKSLKEKVRERIYRGIFSKPDVKVIHPNIHNGRAFSINKTVASGGQYTAVALMIMAKLAEYTMQRESDNRHDPSSIRRRAVSSSSSVLIIDGLFSNLSDRAMIRNSLESLRASRGNFQLIGLIHSPAYENNSEIFPTYIIGKGLADPSDPQGPTGIVYLKDGNKIASPNDMGREAGEMDSFAIHVTH